MAPKKGATTKAMKEMKAMTEGAAMKAMKEMKAIGVSAMGNRAAMKAMTLGQMQFANDPFAMWEGYAQVNCGGAMNWLFVTLPPRTTSTVLWAGYHGQMYKLEVTHDNPWPQWQLVPEAKEGAVKKRKGAVGKAKKGAVRKAKKGAVRKGKKGTVRQEKKAQ